MDVRTILVHADSDSRYETRLSLAAEFARQHKAKLFAVFVMRPPVMPMMEGGYVPADLIQLQIDAEKERAEKVRVISEHRLRLEDVAWEWRCLDGDIASTLARAGAMADLMIMGQASGGSDSDEIAAVALTSGCPVLCVPSSGTFPSCGKRILVAWNSSRESARALRDAMPFLKTADVVTLFAADEDPNAVATTMDTAARLAAHGVKVETKQIALGEGDAGTAILQAATDASADLVVMGAYGHSRLREWVFGGATRSMLQEMKVPTLLAH